MHQQNGCSIATFIQQSQLKLKGMCIRYGLTYLEQEESYTSKASFLDGDKIPIYNADNPTEYSFSGKQFCDAARPKGVSPMSDCLYDRVVCIKRAEGKLINADCNGAANIGSKSNLMGVYPGQTLRHLWLCH
uniref:hypothetical protein n=1 Tax=Okeania sp. SIO2F4 TaxID=2607790 RepID=UPI0025E52B77|nr:hypothetical protein [Okeania sp. SIO2F4]